MKMNDLKAVVNSNEQILWEGRPNKKVFILESIFNPLLPIAIIWGAIDFSIMGFSLSDMAASGMGIFLVGFFALHLMPVWLYLGGVLLSVRRYNHTYYIITDAGIYASGGTFAYSYNMHPFTKLGEVTMHRGIFDQWLGVGDVLCGQHTYRDSDGDTHSAADVSLINLSDYQEVYKLVKGLQRDVFSDTMYPNDLRPNANHGYKSEYMGDANKQ